MMARKNPKTNLDPLKSENRQAVSEEKRAPVLSGLKANTNVKVSIKINRQVADQEFSREGSVSNEASIEPARFRINSN